jgi:Fe-S-cluster containining protein
MHMGGTPSLLAYRYHTEHGTVAEYEEMRDAIGPRLPDDLNAELIGLIDGWLANDNWPADVPCIWLDTDTRQCRHYEYRPNVCRDFQAGSKACRAHRDRMQIGGGR